MKTRHLVLPLGFGARNKAEAYRAQARRQGCGGWVDPTMPAVHGTVPDQGDGFAGFA